MPFSAVIPTRKRYYQTLIAIKTLVPHSGLVSEIIVVVDDEACEVEKYQEVFHDAGLLDIIVIPNAFTRGAQGARATGLQASTEELVYFLDSDDMAVVDGIALGLKTLLADPEIGLVYSNVLLNGRASNFLELNGDCFLDVLKNLSLCPFSGMMIRKSKLDINSLSLELPAWQDDDFCLVLSRLSLVRFIDLPAARMNASIDSISRSKRKQFLGLDMLLSKWEKDIIYQLGYHYYFAWKIRKFALLLESIEQNWESDKRLPLLSILRLLIFRLPAKICRLSVQRFFDRIYA